MSRFDRWTKAITVAAFILAPLALSGCAPLLIAGGAVGGYAIAKNLDSTPPPPPQSQGNKGWLSGGK